MANANLYGEDDFRRMLIRGLVGHEHLQMFNDNVHFKMAIDMLVDHYLPALVNGLAADAARRKGAYDMAYLEALKAPRLLDPELVKKFFPDPP